MANVSHASLTGSNLHEPKGVASAALGTVYVADGAGSGSWTDVGTASFTGMIADFITPVAPTGWLECDGSTISTSTYSALYNVMAIHTSGTRTNGSPIITSISSTATFKVGNYVFGTGIPTGSTIVTIDSSSQITISNNATSSGTSAFDVSPWLLNTGTIKLPDLTTVGRFRRSRSSTTKVGDLQADQNQAHTHTVSGSTDSQGAHTHTINITDPTHAHPAGPGDRYVGSVSGNNSAGANSTPTTVNAMNTFNTGLASTGITASSVSAGAHTHTVTGTAASSGSTEARPLAIVVLTCVKT